MATCGEARGDDLVPGRRHDDVEEKIGAAPRKEGLNVASDDHLLEGEFGGARLGAVLVEVGETDDLQVGNLRDCREPSPAHGAAADQGGLQLHQRLSPRDQRLSGSP